MQTPRLIQLSQVLDIHNRQINKFGGTSGIRDEGLLDSALAQPQATFGGQLLHPTLPEQAAAYLYHLAKNHPFVDGNKRTAFAVMDTFLRINRYRLDLSPDATYQMVLDVVGDKMSKEALSRRLRIRR
ncbi:type II toxin-antitoxin system death-on-curing family toxin [Laspinema olomoucense]|uniref:type II toxin-antitoxin system death-on-curing family toxin n=1 Tax=Laspinema olomoucense TaxID=3231600 RepID=UPI0021BA49EA|nr:MULTISPECIES: type II toxin-antitoxin system death-on-curing family toxin [unclassified Laspinema]MCT7972936.1 type II toxin-antitoxin system death-on-curing family toxin [Laspinema sp. D3d]MCT7987093.1 type II toxin-antitoxin system death-on-curing family toxin [Laspinema sp. D3a]MCT7994213.1 type II toxin-antitoxin system death-on-curing family toxin [Laspinema sp. D3c]